MGETLRGQDTVARRQDTGELPKQGRSKRREMKDIGVMMSRSLETGLSGGLPNEH